MKNRTISSVVLIAIALLAVILSESLVYPVALAILAVIALFEILRVVGVHKNPAIVIPAYAIAVAFPIGAFFVQPNTGVYFLLALAGGVFIYLLWLMGVSVFSKGKIAFSRISEAFASVIYITVSITSLSLLRYFDRSSGGWAVVLVFVISWSCDTFAFLVGSLLGKHKLIPEISPKKTVEGAIGGIVFSIIFCLVYGFGLSFVFENATVDYLALGLCGSILAVVSQLGDLVASLIKREYGVKDYGNLLPGHGGVMDRFDSVFAISTVLLIIFIIYPPFVFS